MPLGFERLNERVKRPNELINFIRPLPGPDSALSKDFLERIAAISYPIMKANHIAVMALEDYPPNPEFLGRNFNAGEVIQLVLKSNSGAWLPFKHVQMVMMHELAHCKEMNHSKSFWRVRNGFSDELRSLWQKGYTGEGLWGGGRGLKGAYLTNEMPAAGGIPSSLCGGAYRGRRKRKRRHNDKPTLSYAERQQKRILKKFGGGGAAVGEDENSRKKLENGKTVKGKPRVAGSARGRELRAAAALARFDKVKEETGSEFGESDSESDFSWPDSDTETATDSNGRKLHDVKGQDLIRVCGEEDQDDDNVRQEMRELMTGVKDESSFGQQPSIESWGSVALVSEALSDPLITKSNVRETVVPRSGTTSQGNVLDPAPKTLTSPHGLSNTEHRLISQPSLKAKKGNHDVMAGSVVRSGAAAPKIKPEAMTTFSSSFQNKPFIDLSNSSPNDSIPELAKPELEATKASASVRGTAAKPPDYGCSACSFINDSGAILCATCCNVLDPSTMWNHWRCDSIMCKGGPYVNAGDYGRCQLCGATKPVNKT